MQMNTTCGLSLMDCGSSSEDRKDYQGAGYLKREVYNTMRILFPGGFFEEVTLNLGLNV